MPIKIDLFVSGADLGEHKNREVVFFKVDFGEDKKTLRTQNIISRDFRSTGPVIPTHYGTRACMTFSRRPNEHGMADRHGAPLPRPEPPCNALRGSGRPRRRRRRRRCCHGQRKQWAGGGGGSRGERGTASADRRLWQGLADRADRADLWWLCVVRE